MKNIVTLVFFLISASILPAENFNNSTLHLTSGITVDVAPFGIEQVYFTLKGDWVYRCPVLLGVSPSYSVNRSSRMLRVPFITGISRYIGRNRNIFITGYSGAGIEFYFSDYELVFSPLLTCGILFQIGIFVIDIPVVSALRRYNTDSDIGITVGFSIPLSASPM